MAVALSTLGVVMGTASIPATAVGYRELWEWASRLGTVLHRAGVEGSGNYGAALSRYLLARRVEVFEVNRPDRSVRRRRGKSDPVDAQEAARAVLSGRACSQAKARDGPVQCARLFKLAKDSAVKARTQAINQLKAILVTADPDLREQLAGLKNPALVRTCAQFEAREDDDGVRGDAVGQATRIALCLLAQRIDQLTGQIRDLDRRLTGLV
ncbi:transposase [Streptomyces decoyicus]